MRIVAGRFRGRAIAGPSHDGLRPTSDRVREAVFNILAHGVDDLDLAGAHVIDLFAGTGALGLEAMSRGAAFCLFVEESAEGRGLLRTNIEALQLTGETRIFRRDATRLGPLGRGRQYDLAFLDPPYGQGLATAALDSLAAGDWLIDGAIVVLEERTGAVPVLPLGFAEIDRRSWGDTEVVVARFRAPRADGPAGPKAD